MSTKKETLTEKCVRLERTVSKQVQTIETLQSNDSSVRSRFTTVLNSPNQLGGSYWGMESQQRTLSWEEIFFQVGSISARLFNNQIRDDLNDLRQRVDDLSPKEGKAI